MRRITQIRRRLSDVFNIRNEMVQAVNDRDERALKAAIGIMKDELFGILVELERAKAEDQEAMEREV